MKKCICILAGAALLVSCTEKEKNTAQTNTTTTPATDVPAPSPVTVPGKRTERGTVIGLTAAQIKLQVPVISPGYDGAGGPGTFLIDRHPDHNPDETTVTSGTLAIGSSVEIKANEGDWHNVPGA